MIISMEEDHNILGYQETIKVDIEYISKKYKNRRPMYKFIDT